MVKHFGIEMKYQTDGGASKAMIHIYLMGEFEVNDIESSDKVQFLRELIRTHQIKVLQFIIQIGVSLINRQESEPNAELHRDYVDVYKLNNIIGTDSNSAPTQRVTHYYIVILLIHVQRLYVDAEEPNLSETDKTILLDSKIYQPAHNIYGLQRS